MKGQELKKRCRLGKGKYMMKCYYWFCRN